MKEADELKERITQIEHAAALTFNSMKLMPRTELYDHMAGIIAAGWKLPFVRSPVQLDGAEGYGHVGGLARKRQENHSATTGHGHGDNVCFVAPRDRGQVPGARDHCSGKVWLDESSRIKGLADIGTIGEGEVAAELSKAAQALGCCFQVRSI